MINNNKVPRAVWYITACGFLFFIGGLTIHTIKSDNLKLSIANATIETKKTQLKIANEAHELREKSDRLQELTDRLSRSKENFNQLQAKYTKSLESNKSLFSSCSPASPKIEMEELPKKDNSIDRELSEIQKELTETEEDLTEEIEILTNESVNGKTTNLSNEAQ